MQLGCWEVMELVLQQALSANANHKLPELHYTVCVLKAPITGHLGRPMTR